MAAIKRLFQALVVTIIFYMVISAVMLFTGITFFAGLLFTPFAFIGITILTWFEISMYKYSEE